MERAEGGGWQELFTGRRRLKGKEYDPACNVKWLDDEALEAFVSRSFLSGHTTCWRYSNSRQSQRNNRKKGYFVDFDDGFRFGALVARLFSVDCRLADT